MSAAAGDIWNANRALFHKASDSTPVRPEENLQHNTHSHAYTHSTVHMHRFTLKQSDKTCVLKWTGRGWSEMLDQVFHVFVTPANGG